MTSRILPVGHPWAPPAPTGSWCEPTSEERAAYERLRSAGNGDPIAGRLPIDDPYHVVLYGWAEEDLDRAVSQVWQTGDGCRYLVVDGGTALTLQTEADRRARQRERTTRS